jgi:predicted  nucleic acid-binding Zn-ribbon protein
VCVRCPAFHLSRPRKEYLVRLDIAYPVRGYQKTGGTPMLNDVTEVENELRSVTQEKRRMKEQIMALQQRIRDDETWLRRNTPTIVGYQATLEEVVALEAYVVELHAQVASLDDVMLELTLECEHWLNPDLPLFS